jgi:hypothetical protein
LNFLLLKLCHIFPYLPHVIQPLESNSSTMELFSREMHAFFLYSIEKVLL